MYIYIYISLSLSHCNHAYHVYKYLQNIRTDIHKYMYIYIYIHMKKNMCESKLPAISDTFLQGCWLFLRTVIRDVPAAVNDLSEKDSQTDSCYPCDRLQ